VNDFVNGWNEHRLGSNPRTTRWCGTHREAGPDEGGRPDEVRPPDEVLELREIERPVAGDDEVLVRVRAASVHPDVWHVVTGRPYVLRLMGAGC